MSGDFLESSRAHLESLCCRSDCVTLVLHHVDLALIFKHFVQVTPHFVGHLIQSLLNFVSSGRIFSFFEIKVRSCKVWSSIESALKLDNYVTSHGVERLNRVRALSELGIALVKHIGETLQEIVCVVIGECTLSDNYVADHISILEHVPCKTKMAGLGPSARNLVCLSAKKCQTVVSDILILFRRDNVAGLAGSEHRLVTHASDAHKVNLIVLRSSFNHFS